MDLRIHRAAGLAACLAFAAAVTACTVPDGGAVDAGPGVMVSPGNESGRATGSTASRTADGAPPTAAPAPSPTPAPTPAAPPQAPTVALATGCLGRGGDIVVPAGADCSLGETVVAGDVLVGSGASLQLAGTTVRGRVDAPGPFADVVIAGASIGGEMRLEGGATATVRSTTVGGDVRVDDTGDVRLQDNRVTGRVECDGNGPVSGRGNAAERLEGDCAGL